MSRLSTSSKVKLLVAAVLAAGAWYAFAPASLGGYDSYVITDGTSMLPTIHGGGVVVTRKESSYHVGEVVAYRNSQLDNLVVLHRITAIKDGHYTFKGDNNSYPDTASPTKSALVGREWIYLPSGGTFFLNLKSPIVGAVIMAVLGMWAFADLGRPKQRLRRRRRHHHAATA
jgi:signal peptidase I